MLFQSNRGDGGVALLKILHKAISTVNLTKKHQIWNYVLISKFEY